MFYLFNTIETIVKLQPQYSDVFRGVLNKKKQLINLEVNEQVQINDEYDSLVEKIIDQLEEIEELIDKDFEKNFDKYDDVMSDLWFLFQEQTSAIITNHLVLSELMFLYYAPVRPPLQERRRMSEANHSLSKCGDIRAQIHIGPSQYVSHYFFCS